jgi:homospermidine synthase
MPNHSNKKKRGQQSNITIDEKHTQMLNEFHSLETSTIPELEQQRVFLKKELASIDESDIDKKMEIKDQIRDINEHLKKYKMQKNNYLLDNVPYFQLF